MANAVEEFLKVVESFIITFIKDTFPIANVKALITTRIKALAVAEPKLLIQLE